MKTRRDFIKTAAIAGVGLAFTRVKADTKITIPNKINKPIVLSTWRFGIEANVAAWEVLKQNGRALDAV
jgi:N4-(beta-N-acetylglucosaminyl)-L-asparaginase